MFNFLIKNTVKKVIIKIATDKNLRNKLGTGIKRAQELNSKGMLIKTVGKIVGKYKNRFNK